MAVIHYIDPNRQVILTQLVDRIPAVDESIKIKGRKGKVLRIAEDENNHVQIHVELEPAVKKRALAIDNKKKKR